MKKNSQIRGTKSIKQLQRILGVSLSRLELISNQTHRYYNAYKMCTDEKPKWRRIDNPNQELKNIQRKILQKVLNEASLPKNFFGGVRKRSNIDNALFHKNSNTVVNIDIKNCFPNTNNRSIYRIYKDDFDFSSKIARILTNITTFRRRLPQGAPTSSMLINLCMLPIFHKIKNLCDLYNVKISFYVDDITLSGTKAFLIIPEVIKILNSFGYATRYKKVKVLRNDNIEVTGVAIKRGMIYASDSKVLKLVNMIEEIEVMNQVSEAHLKSLNGQLKYIARVNTNHLPELNVRIAKIATMSVRVDGKLKNIYFKSCKN